MCSAISATSGCSAWTVTSGAGVLSFLLQPAPSTSPDTSAIIIALTAVDLSRLIFISQRPRQSLQIGQARFVTHQTVFARVLRSGERRLRVHYFQHRCFSCGVAHLG